VGGGGKKYEHLTSDGTAAALRTDWWFLVKSGLRENFLRNGFTLIPNVFDSNSLDVLRNEVVALVDGFYSRNVGGPHYWSYTIEGRREPILYRIHNLEKQPGCPAVVGLFTRSRLHELAAECLGEPSFPTVCAAAVKLPYVGAPVPWHRDRDHDEVRPGKAVNVSLYLHDSAAGNGCLEVAAGSQLADGGIDVGEYRRRHRVTPVPSHAGDATVHDVRPVHGSAAAWGKGSACASSPSSAPIRFPHSSCWARSEPVLTASDQVCLIAPPLRTGSQWVTVPPAGYGGIQWSMAHLMDGLLERGVRLTLLGAPGSWNPARLEVADAGESADIVAWLMDNRPLVIHDFANFSAFHERVPPGSAYCRTWQLTGEPPGRGNTVFVSAAQMRSADVDDAVVIPLPVNASRYYVAERKGDYLLFLGRISAWKGAYEASALARFLGLPLLLAGPAWERDYVDLITTDYPGTATLVGEVGGERRATLLTEARALTVLSQPVPGPWGQTWCEPGAAVVAEAAVSGTPVIATANGCLPSLMPGIGVVMSTGSKFTDASILSRLPAPGETRECALARWDHRAIADQYLRVYDRCLRGERWK